MRSTLRLWCALGDPVGDPLPDELGTLVGEARRVLADHVGAVNP